MYFFHNIFFKSNYLKPSSAVSASLKEAKAFDPSTIRLGRSYMIEWAQNHHVVSLGSCLEHIVIEGIKSQSL
jgi:hypothetical protein